MVVETKRLVNLRKPQSFRVNSCVLRGQKLLAPDTSPAIVFSMIATENLRSPGSTPNKSLTHRATPIPRHSAGDLPAARITTCVSLLECCSSLQLSPPPCVPPEIPQCQMKN